jgi:hypothetical protein
MQWLKETRQIIIYKNIMIGQHEPHYITMVASAG